MYKLGCLASENAQSVESGKNSDPNSGLPDWVEFIPPAVYQVPDSPDELQRIVASVPKGNPDVILGLAETLTPPFYLLYVLHTPRGEGPPGRYQSPELSLQEVRLFISRFRNFLAEDARFDFWIHSPADQATLVWDRHNQLYAYGPISRFVAAFGLMGFVPGISNLPSPHEHHYHPEHDTHASELLASLNWQHSPLTPSDEQ